MDEERREDGLPATFGVADDILRYETQLHAFPCKRLRHSLTALASRLYLPVTCTPVKGKAITDIHDPSC